MTLSARDIHRLYTIKIHLKNMINDIERVFVEAITIDEALRQITIDLDIIKLHLREMGAADG